MINIAADTENHAVQSKSKHKYLILKLNLQISKGEITQGASKMSLLLESNIAVCRANKIIQFEYHLKFTRWYEGPIWKSSQLTISLWEHLAMLSN